MIAIAFTLIYIIIGLVTNRTVDSPYDRMYALKAMSTVYSKRLNKELHLGKRDAKEPSSDHVKFSEVLKTIPSGSIPAIPHWFGHAYDFGASNWLMLGNGPDDTVFKGFGGAGNCFWAGGAHEEMEGAKQGARTIPVFSGKTVIDQYAAYSGYDPNTGANDNGTDVQEGYRWRQEKGLYDDSGAVYKIGQTVALTPGDINQLWTAAYLFEAVGVGVTFQQAQMDQFDNGQAWDYVAGSSDEGGHYIPVMGKNGLISWGARPSWTKSWYEHLCDEAYAFIDPIRYNQVTGETTEHFKDQDLEKYALAIVQLKQG